jgi:6,7-dimethyl-8-ribityllumazine synthase
LTVLPVKSGNEFPDNIKGLQCRPATGIVALQVGGNQYRQQRAFAQKGIAMTVGTYESNLNGEGVRIGIVQARFNEDVCHGLLSACLAELKHLGVADEDVLHVSVPGALEIPLALQKMAETQQFDALIALGAVIRGETYHFELVSNESGAGITRVGLDFGIPIANAVLTTDTDEQAEARMAEKGTDAARVAVEMANLAIALEELAEATEEE